MSFEEISHTADVKIRAQALTLDALFTDAFLALMQIVYGTDRKVGIIKEIRIESDTIESLLIDFLSEVLFIAEVEGLVFSDAEIKIDGLSLTAILKGEFFDPLRHSSLDFRKKPSINLVKIGLNQAIWLAMVLMY